MTLHESIILEIDHGLLKPEIRAGDLLTDARKVSRMVNGSLEERYRVGFEFFSANHLRTELPNTTEGGYWTQAGRPARYQRLTTGLYQVIGRDEDEEVIDIDAALTIEPPTADTGVDIEPPTANADIEYALVEYLRTRPFQIFDLRRRRHHPAQSVTGLAARLDAYFWPRPDIGFQINQQELHALIARAAAIRPDLGNHADEVMRLFADVCEWGGVRQPQTTPQIVIDNLQRAAEQSCDRPATVNSAWSKLYAIFYPDDFVIYDSRVATAIISLAESELAPEALAVFRQRYPALGTVPGRGGTRPRPTKNRWRHAYGCWEAQLNANSLARAMLEIVNQPEGAACSLRHLEAMLFMEGY